MKTDDITRLVEGKTSELLARTRAEVLAACAAVWARVFVLASPGWARWPHLLPTVREGFMIALSYSIGSQQSATSDLLISRLESFDIEDDGSTEWQYVVDLVSMLSAALSGEDLEVCLRTTLYSYLEGTFNVVANELSRTLGRSIAHSDALAQVSASKTWERAVSFVNAL
jgi:hypothetical protein